MVLDNDVVTDGEPKPGSLSGWLRCEKGIEHLFFHFRWNTRAVVPNPDLHAVAEVLTRAVSSPNKHRIGSNRNIGRAVTSALGQRPTCAVRQPMSALPPIATAKADIHSKARAG